jgi:DNA-binding Xre family transcriptional regulator
MLRKERGYTLADLGENIGLDKSNTFRLEQGKNFTLLTLIKIAAFLNVQPNELLNIPFNVDFPSIENSIAAKKQARKQRKGPLKKSQSRVSAKGTYPITTPISLAAEPKKSLMKKEKKSKSTK